MRMRNPLFREAERKGAIYTFRRSRQPVQLTARKVYACVFGFKKPVQGFFLCWVCCLCENILQKPAESTFLYVVNYWKTNYFYLKMHTVYIFHNRVLNCRIKTRSENIPSWPPSLFQLQFMENVQLHFVNNGLTFLSKNKEQTHAVRRIFAYPYLARWVSIATKQWLIPHGITFLMFFFCIRSKWCLCVMLSHSLHLNSIGKQYRTRAFLVILNYFLRFL